MSEKPIWGIGSDQYRKPPERPITTRRSQSESQAGSPTANDQARFTGITWDLTGIDLDVIGGTGDSERARHRFRSRLPDMIWDAARLEGNTFTLPEVRTLLEGVTVAGKRLDEERQILALNEGFNDVDALVGAGQFSLNKAVSDRIHAHVAAFEAIEAGHFRGEGQVQGGGSVRLSTGGVVDGREHGSDGSVLKAYYDDLLDFTHGISDARLRALVYAASAIRHQFYFDGNKRTAKLMASGELMANGFDAISIPYTRLYEQNRALDHLFSTDDATPLMRLMADCAR
ncbi:hypothetical protein [Subtercola lobariae]|uniref:Fido domain-containing protein n=1 Tax=Subtercola lobariae TaxID=1588641 RepID=A0A917B562_9MICO|nr:hypothetical protein [Subtercola lobariae]GGF24424.1 hypothetical protein GCM10011399_17420 [Subtercola lobariae]